MHRPDDGLQWRDQIGMKGTQGRYLFGQESFLFLKLLKRSGGFFGEAAWAPHQRQDRDCHCTKTHAFTIT